MLPVSANEGPWYRRFGAAVAHPMQWFNGMTAGGPGYALLILFGLNVVDELGRATFGVLAPDIAEHFGVGLTGITIPFALAYLAAIGLSVPIATLADRYNRVRMALVGGVIFAAFSAGMGLSVSVWMLGAMAAGSQVGKSIIEPAHSSLLADYFSVEVRPRIYSFHRAANPIGAGVGGLLGGWLGHRYGWQVPFFVLAVPVLVLVLIGAKLPNPVRGGHERRLMGATGASADTEEEAPTFAESWRMCWQIDSLRRIYRTLPFLTPAVVGFGLFASFLYDEAFGYNAQTRGQIEILVMPFPIIGLTIGAKMGMKLFAKDPKLVFGLLSKVIFVVTASTVVFAWAPNGAVAVGAQMVLAGSLAMVIPGIFAALSLAIPARARAMGFSMGAIFVLPGLVSLPLIAWVGDAFGIRWGMTVMAPMFLLGGLVIGSAGNLITRDIQQVWSAAAARSEVLYERRQGRSKLLLVRGLNVSYGDVQVLFDVDFEVDEGEIIALLGTNGAGKSTLLKSICGLVPANKGTVIFDGRDITYSPAYEVAPRGVVLVPGGQGVFPSLTVAENLRTAAWIDRRHRSVVAERTAEVLDLFPVLADRMNEPAANLSGGQQQMLALAMAFLSRPRLVMIDELSLGLAPVVVEQLLEVVERIRAQGTTIIVVEQSVNVALTLADEAYFMEKGEIRFHGPTAELLERPDVLRSVFLEGAAAGMAGAAATTDSGVGATTGNGADAPEDDAVTSTPGAPPGPTPTTRQASTKALRDAPPDDEVPALELVGVTRSFGGIRAVDDVSLRLRPGEILGIIGPNGAGKTTLFDLVSGFNRADTGRILLGGDDITGLSAHGRARRGLGRSFQDARLFPAMTVEQCVAVALDRFVSVRDPMQAALYLPAVFDAERDVQRRVDELIDLLGLEAFRTKFVHELSTGSRRIVDLACLVAHRPTVILLDEPSSGIAQRETEALAPVLDRIREQLGASLVVIEHDMPLLRSVSDRLLALELGRTVTQGPVEEVLRHPEVVASYLGSTEAVIARSGARAEV
jgi:ABC-type branched-subunit amino acid transport system ATPase component/MFS family permease